MQNTDCSTNTYVDLDVFGVHYVWAEISWYLSEFIIRSSQEPQSIDSCHMLFHVCSSQFLPNMPMVFMDKTLF